MKNVLKRIYKIVRSKTPSPESIVETWLRKKTKTDFGESWEKSSQDTEFKNNYSVPRQIVDDLAAFGLTPPSCLDEVRKARNREIKKYHSDKFMNDPEKLETSKQIMQIYNAAYDRLKVYYDGKNK
ncbi:Chaperone J-domain-containing protein [Desulfonema limicola]|uniref:Chaperone J-domain-containing protein n=1 Tax=Desulfonema limicola TaxID=45656 RepID=A0A975BB55_9BACT|nr:hypothetical protein [Desulfonema limicola]QTA82131.1 Chaperone J-domain-containing protein [Desulfonema limicola]